MVSSKRRRVDTEAVDEDFVERRKFEKYKRKILSDEEPISFKTIRHLKELLADSKDDINFVTFVSGAVTQRLVCTLLCEYGATVVEKDRAIYDLLFLLERTYHIPLRPLAPLVWGPRSKANYENLRKLGQTLHTRLTSDQVLEYLDARRVWFTLLKLDVANYSNDGGNNGELYDYRFILRLLISILEPGAELSSRKFIESNALSFAFAATSVKCHSDRALSYVILRRFLSHLSDLSVEDFVEKSLFIYLIRFFRNSIERPNQRIPHVVSHFFARTSKLLLNAADPVYGPVLSFLLLKPTIDLGNVPEFYKLFLSSSTEHYREERHWILTLIADSLIEPNDYNVFQKRYGIKLCLSLFTSSISDMESRKLVLIILRSALKHQSVAKDLFHRQNLQSWIVLTIQQQTVTRWEKVFLCQLFVTLLEHVRTDYLNDESLTSDEIALQQKICQMLGAKVQKVLAEEDDEGKAMWWQKLDDVMNTEWKRVDSES
ncbi:Nucleolar pre-ribosomal-associated protein 1 [Toxocara canis]|uniref:Nucleolar pre-ribosomal-associated protein 1 n=1 Tax=Toxocara canis TaxID=6265 RepID=A0A0B2UWN7_TOXCA|nr:Nucleolar pre-ribosomal-associated protein 1 [Toxocara canis]